MKAEAVPLLDLFEKKQRLDRLGFEVETAEHVWVHRRSLYVRDPEGNRVELVCCDEDA